MDRQEILKELSFKAVRSSGPGGQHVNKTSSKVSLGFHISTSNGLSEAEKLRLAEMFANRLNSDGVLILTCGESRSQHRNKAMVIDRLFLLLKKGLKVNPPRKKRKISKAAIEKRLKEKKTTALKKANRRRPFLD